MDPYHIDYPQRLLWFRLAASWFWWSEGLTSKYNCVRRDANVNYGRKSPHTPRKTGTVFVYIISIVSKIKVLRLYDLQTTIPVVPWALPVVIGALFPQ